MKTPTIASLIIAVFTFLILAAPTRAGLMDNIKQKAKDAATSPQQSQPADSQASPAQQPTQQQSSAPASEQNQNPKPAGFAEFELAEGTSEEGSAPAKSRLVKTEEEVAARYGTGKSITDQFPQFKFPIFTYNANDFSITVLFNEATKRSELEIIESKQQGGLSQETFSVLMKAFGGKAWIPKDVASSGVDKYWLEWPGKNKLYFRGKGDPGINKDAIKVWCLSDDSIYAIALFRNSRPRGSVDITKENLWRVAFMTREFAKINLRQMEEDYRIEQERLKKEEERKKTDIFL